MKKITELLCMNVPTLKKYLVRFLNTFYQQKVWEHDTFIFAEGNIPVVLLAHMDTVHVSYNKQIVFDREQKILWSPQGIGGDDRCGIYAIMQLITKGYKPYVLFTDGEEKGGIGAEDAVKKLIPPEVKYLVEIDRRGNNQAVFYDCGNTNFINYILSFGFIENYGSFSDISFISPEWDVASVNFSAGYYNEHTFTEYINLNHLDNTIDKVSNLLDDINNSEFYDYCEAYAYKYNFNKTNVTNTSTTTQYTKTPACANPMDDDDEDDADWYNKYYGTQNQTTPSAKIHLDDDYDAVQQQLEKECKDLDSEYKRKLDKEQDDAIKESYKDVF